MMHACILTTETFPRQCQHSHQTLRGTGLQIEEKHTPTFETMIAKLARRMLSQGTCPEVCEVEMQADRLRHRQLLVDCAFTSWAFVLA